MLKLENISLIMPVYNESKTIEKVIRSYYSNFFRYCKNSEFIITEDGSTDGTRELLKRIQKELKFRLITSPNRKGYEKARNDALKLAKNSTVLFSDSDGQHEPRDFFALCGEMKKKNLDLVVGSKVDRKDTFYRKIISKFQNFLYGMVFGLWLKDANCGFRIYNRMVIDELVDKVKLLPYAGNAEFVIRARHNGFRVGEYPVRHYSREFGQGVVFSFSKMPRVIFSMIIGVVKLRIELFRNNRM